MAVSFTKGNGLKRLVLVKEGSAVNANPTDLSSYLADGNFGNGDERKFFGRIKDGEALFTKGVLTRL